MPKRKRERLYYATDKFKFNKSEWCGPGWSDGKWQSNRCGYATARSHFDQACKNHDCNLADGMSEQKADAIFWGECPNPIIGMAPHLYHTAKKNLELFHSSKNNLMSHLATPHKERKNDKMAIDGNTAIEMGPGAMAMGGNSNVFKISGKVREQRNQHKGVGFYYESGGQNTETIATGLNSSKVLYIGHGTRSRIRDETAIWCAIVKKLANKAGLDVTNLENAFAGSGTAHSYQLRVYYVQSSVGSEKQYASTFLNNVSVLNLVATFLTFIQATANNNTFQDKLYFKGISLFVGSTTDNRELATMTLSKCQISMNIHCELLWQNNTLAASTGTNNNLTDIETACPVNVVQYSIKNGAFGIEGFDHYDDALLSSNNLGKTSATTYYGSFYSGNVNIVPELIKFLSSPPAHNDVKWCTAVHGGVLQPGAMLLSVVTHNSKLMLDQFYDNSTSTDANNLSNGEYGRCHWLAISKTIDGRFAKSTLAGTWETKLYQECEMGYTRGPQTETFKTVQLEVI
jgi:hypothetical protein